MNTTHASNSIIAGKVERSPRKPRAQLMLLPRERQQIIASYAQTHTLAATVDWLRTEGIQTGIACLSRFLSWYNKPAVPVADDSVLLDVVFHSARPVRLVVSQKASKVKLQTIRLPESAQDDNGGQP